ncbi:uncharacterized protein LOC143919223 [Arctopsyche grandis]|uniref:uncharacterized protein LOC143919223 n=1 Tax=Arctopsyche grandis TaxID=121162 RepID=UPI00406D8741
METPEVDNIEKNEPAEESNGVTSNRYLTDDSEVDKKIENIGKSEMSQFQYSRDYEGYIAMLFILRGAVNKYRFKIGVEVEQAKKFDDIVFFYEKERNVFSKCVQAKHTTMEKNIDLNQLLTGEQSDFSLVKYFFSYKDLVRENCYKDVLQNDLILYTNYSLQMDSFIGTNLKVSKIWQPFESTEFSAEVDKVEHLLEPISNKDDILGVDSKRYRFKGETIQILKSKANEYNVTRMIQSLNYCLSGKKTFEDVEYVVRPYWKFLTEEVIDIENKSLRENLLNLDKKHMSKEARFFFKKLIEEIGRKNSRQSKQNRNHNNNNSLENEVEKFSKNMNKKVHRKLKKQNNKCDKLEEEKMIINCINEKAKHTNFPTWKSVEENQFDNIIKEDEIEDFLKLFVFAVSQPNHEELKKIIKADILEDQRRKYDGDNFYTEKDIDRYAEEILQYFHAKVFEWKDADGSRKKINKKTYMTNKDGEKFLENQWEEVKFNVKQPVTSFMGRDDELEALHKSIQRGTTVKSQTRVICGLPGMGKTELIRGYIQRYGHRFENKVLWIDAKSHQSIEDSFRRVAEMLKIQTLKSDGQSENIRKIVAEVYREFESKKCLIAFDDVSSPELIYPFMPKQTSSDNFPFIIITSPNSKWDIEQKTDLNVLTEQNALMLMQSQLSIGDSVDLKYIQQLTNILEYFPLAIQQVAAYVVKEFRNDSEFRIEHYIENFSEYAKQSLEFNISSYEKTTYVSFQTIINSIEKFNHIGAKAFDVLSILSFMCPNKIDAKWLSTYSKMDLGEIFQLLKDYSLIRIEAGMISIHKLVQMVTRITLKQRNVESVVVESVLNIFMDYFPIGNNFNDLEIVWKLMPHLEACLTHMNLCNSLPDKLNEKASMLSSMLFNYFFGESADQKNMAFFQEKIIILLKNKCGAEFIKKYDELLNNITKLQYKNIFSDFVEYNAGNHIKYGDMLVKIGDAELNSGNDNNAKVMFEKALVEYLKLGAKDLSIANVYKKLGLIESNSENHTIAKVHFENALSIYLLHYNESHMVVSKLRLNIGSLEIRLGNFKEAKFQNECALQVFLSSKEKNYVDIAKAYRNLGVVEIQFGNNSLAKTNLEMALGGFWAYYGMKHKIVLEIYRNLGMIETRLGNYAAARILYENILPMYLKQFGESDIRVAEVYLGLGIIEVAGKNLKVAKSLYEKALGIYLSHYGEAHLDVAKTCMKLGKLELILGNCNVAKSHFEAALSGFLKCYEDERNIQLGDLYNLLGTVELRLGNVVPTKNYIKQALSTYLTNYGMEHKEVARAYNILCRLPET